MWYLVALLSCLGVLHAEHPQCFCPKTEKLLPSVLDFIITAKVSEVMRKDAEGFQPLKITDTRVIKPENTTTFSDIVYTKGERGWFGVTPNPGTRFILEGIFDENKRPMVTSCELLRECEKSER